MCVGKFVNDHMLCAFYLEKPITYIFNYSILNFIVKLIFLEEFKKWIAKLIFLLLLSI